MSKDYIKLATQFEEDILSGKIPANIWIRLACERSKNDRVKYAAADSPYFFDADRATRACRFMERLRLVEDSIATKGGERLSLMPFQCWILVSLFGWVCREDNTRRFRRCVLFMGRGNAKTTLASACAIYVTFAEKTQGAECCMAASQKEQAGICLDSAREMLKADPDLCAALGVKVFESKIIQPASKSRMWSLPAKASSAEGHKSNFVVLDELFAQRGRSLYETLGSGLAKRKNSLYMLISTSGDQEGVAWELVTFLREVLHGTANDESTFIGLWGMNDDSDWTSTDTHIMANPAWGITVSPRNIAEACSRAQQMVSEKRNFLQKHCCSFLAGNGSDEDVFQPEDLHKCYDSSLKEENFAGLSCTMGMDVASTQDLASIYKIFMRRDGKGRPIYFAFGRSFLPGRIVENSPAKSTAISAGVARKEIFASGDSTTDQDDLTAYVLEQLGKFAVQSVNYDPFQAAGIVGTITKKTGKADLCVLCRQIGMVLTPGVKELLDAVASGRFKTSDSTLLWAMRNLRVRKVGMNFLQPCRPEKRRDLKVDPAIAVICAMRAAAVAPIDQAKSSNPTNDFWMKLVALRESGQPVSMSLDLSKA
jgi:phage terminase large subunit-like protein